MMHPSAELPVWVNAGAGQSREFPSVPAGKTSYLTTTELLMRAQALLDKVEPTEHRKPKRRSRPHSPTSSYRSDSSQSSHFSCDRDLSDVRLKRHRRKHRASDDVVRFKVGSATPEKENSVDVDDDDDDDEEEQLSERLREMDVSDLVDQRDVLTRQIVTSLVTLHQLNQELDRRRRRKSYSTFRKKDVASNSAPTLQKTNGKK